MTDFCIIATPSDVTETIKSFRVGKVSASGHTRLRPLGRQSKREFKLSWSAMTAADKATLFSFYEDNSALEFNWMHPLTGTTYLVYFDDEKIDSKIVKGLLDRWQVSFVLGEA